MNFSLVTVEMFHYKRLRKILIDKTQDGTFEELLAAYKNIWNYMEDKNISIVDHKPFREASYRLSELQHMRRIACQHY